MSFLLTEEMVMPSFLGFPLKHMTLSISKFNRDMYRCKSKHVTTQEQLCIVLKFSLERTLVSVHSHASVFV